MSEPDLEYTVSDALDVSFVEHHVALICEWLREHRPGKQERAMLRALAEEIERALADATNWSQGI